MSTFDWENYYNNRKNCVNAITDLMRRLSKDPSYGNIYIREHLAFSNLINTIFECYPVMHKDEIEAITHIKELASCGCVAWEMDYPKTISLAVSTKKTVVQMSEYIKTCGDNVETVLAESCKIILVNIISDIYNNYYSESEPIGTGYIRLLEIVSYIIAII